MASLFENIKADILAAGSFVQAQEQAGHDAATILEQQSTAAESRIQNLHQVITTQQASDLTTIIVDGPWSLEQKKRLSSAVAAVLNGNATKNAARRCMQRVNHFENYSTEAEWRSLRSSALRAHKIQQVAARAHSLGITCPTETNTFRMACIVAECDNIDTADELGRVHADIKKCIKSLDVRRAYPLKHLCDYPFSADDLPTDMFEYAYIDTKPVKVDMPGLDATAGKRMRNQKKSVLQRDLDAVCRKHNVLPQQLGNAPSLGQGDTALQIYTTPRKGEDTPSRSSSLRDLAASAFAFKPMLALPAAEPITEDREPLQQPQPLHKKETAEEEDDDASARTGAALGSLERLERRLLGVQTRPAARAAVAKVLKRPAAKRIMKKLTASSANSMLGCGKCRGSHLGCLVCRNPTFKGRRFQK